PGAGAARELPAVPAREGPGRGCAMPATAESSLAEYQAKRDFRRSPEPAPEAAERPHREPIFVVQEHHATRLHSDFRLEAAGVLKSWAVPREPTMDPADKHLAVQVEDHPIPYANFEGTIPKGSYGAGEVSIWDRGTYEPAGGEEQLLRGLHAGKIEFTLHGEKLNGRFALVRMARGGRKENWLLIKIRDERARRTANGRATPKSVKRTRSSRTPSPTRAGGSESPPSRIEVTNPD